MDGPTPKPPSPGGPSDPAGISLEEASRTARFADLAWGPLDAKGAAAFLSLSRDQFNNLAPSMPRHKKPGMGYRYLRSELLAWLVLPAAGDDRGRQPDGNVAVSGRAQHGKNGRVGRVQRLV